MSQKSSSSVVAPDTEAPPASEEVAPSVAPPKSTDVDTSVTAPISTDPPASAALPSTEPKSSGSGLRFKGDKTKFRHLNVDTDKHQYDIPTILPKRPGFNTTGQAVAVNINSFPILKFPDRTVYQYDVSLPHSFQCDAS